jgi:hypothetical protein
LYPTPEWNDSFDGEPALGDLSDKVMQEHSLLASSLLDLRQYFKTGNLAYSWPQEVYEGATYAKLRWCAKWHRCSAAWRCSRPPRT